MSIIALAGGVGGAKLADGLAKVLAAHDLTIIVNTGDDFEHWGLHISPDLDTVMYNLAGINNPQTGWGLAEESWHVFERVGQLGGEHWFRLGDRDIATNLVRTAGLQAGESLTAVTAHLCRALGIEVQVLPMSDAPVRTIVHTPAGSLEFQDYFVRQRCEPAVTGFTFEGAETAEPPAGVVAAFEAGPQAIIVCPSNPFVSVGPLRAVPRLAALMAARQCPLVAVSPIVGGNALKGPAAKMMAELDMPVTVTALAEYYNGFIDALVIDHQDAASIPAIERLGLHVLATDIIMTTAADRARLAQEILDFATISGDK